MMIARWLLPPGAMTDTRVAQLRLGPQVGKGGEATVYSLVEEPLNLVKLYHKPDHERAEKLALMISNPPASISLGGYVTIAWPQRRVFSRTSDKAVIGFIMPRVVGGEQFSLLHNMRSRLNSKPRFDWRYLVRASRNLCSLVTQVHQADYVIGDFNDAGVLVSDTAVVSLVDCDSFQVADPKTGNIHRCPVGMGMFTAPELQGKNFSKIDRTISHDNFALAVLIHLALMGSHPFNVMVARHSEQPTIEDAIRQGLYADAGVAAASPSRGSLPYDVLPTDIRSLLKSAFSGYHQRPSAAQWDHVLADLESSLRTCTRNSHHVYSSHLGSGCPWCARTSSLSGRDPFPSEQAIRDGAHLLRPRRPPQTAPPQGPRAQPIQSPPSSAATPSPVPPPVAASPVSAVDWRKALGGIPSHALSPAVVGFLFMGLWLPAGQSGFEALGVQRADSGLATLGAYVAFWAIFGVARSVYLQMHPVPQAAPPLSRPSTLPGNQGATWQGAGPGSAHHTTAGAVVGNRSSGKFHRTHCEWATKIGRRNRRLFSSRSDAVRAGLSPCRVCRP